MKLPIISVHEITNLIPASTKHMEQFQEETSKDTLLVKPTDVVFNDWPQRKQHLEPNLQLYWSYKDEIPMEHGIILKGSRIIVPELMHPEMLKIICKGHQNQEKVHIACERDFFLAWNI